LASPNITLEATAEPTNTRVPEAEPSPEPVSTAETDTSVTTNNNPVPVNHQTTCQVPPGWNSYTVQAGDTLSRIARQTRVDLNQIIQGNCLANPSLIHPGNIIYLPGTSVLAPTLPAPTAVPYPTIPATVMSEYLDPEFRLQFRYPAHWQRTGPRYYEGDDGFFRIRLLASPHYVQTVAENEAAPSHQPYGSSPGFLEILTEDGRNGIIIYPSGDQDPIYDQQALLLVPYDDLIHANGDIYNYLALAVDVNHINRIAESVTIFPGYPTPTIHQLDVETTDLPDNRKRLHITWNAQGASRGVLTVSSERYYAPYWEVLPVGEMTVELDTHYRNPEVMLQVVSWSITYKDAVARVPLDWPCRTHYFFTPEPEICPAGEPENLQAVYQPFERGFMVWLQFPNSTQPDIYVFAEGDDYDIYPDTWVEGEPESDPNLTPPEGLYQPVRGFGKVWREVSRNTNIGWATAPEQPYTLTTQSSIQESPISNYYLTLPDGRVIHISGFDWQEITVSSPN